MEFVLVGQPNSGKSTIFNSVVGYKSITSNFPGVTVNYTYGEVCLEDEAIQVIDVPGTYSLGASDEAEREAVRYILTMSDDAVLVNVIDASVLSRSLELTLQLMELQRPMVVVLNMMDEVERKGITIAREALAAILGVPVIESVGHKGIGVSEIFKESYRAGIENLKPKVLYGPEVFEKAIHTIENNLIKTKLALEWNTRFTAIKLLEGDEIIESDLETRLAKSEIKNLRKLRSEIERNIKESSEHLVSSFRHNKAFMIFEATAKVKIVPVPDIRKRIDDVLMHPVFGYIFLVLILFSSFWCISAFADITDPAVSALFDDAARYVQGKVSGFPFLVPVFKGFFEGLGGGVAIAIAFLVPFFLFLAFLEDTGYLARIAFISDNLMHRMGLHGMSVVPLILGYGCNVPAIFATGILKSPRERLITASLATLVPCSARMVILLGLVGALFSMKVVVLIYGVNVLVLGIVGTILSKAMGQKSPGLLMEVPRYHMPGLPSLVGKTWLRIKEFLYMALPFLVAGSIVLELINHFGFSRSIDNFLSPFTVGLLGLPVASGVVLLFGIMRKELALLLLVAAMGVHHSNELLTVMTPVQVYSFAVFAVFYVPCLATVATLAKVFNWRTSFLVSAMTFGIAIILTLAVRGLFFLIG